MYRLHGDDVDDLDPLVDTDDLASKFQQKKEEFRQTLNQRKESKCIQGIDEMEACPRNVETCAIDDDELSTLLKDANIKEGEEVNSRACKKPQYCAINRNFAVFHRGFYHFQP